MVPLLPVLVVGKVEERLDRVEGQCWDDERVGKQEEDILAEYTLQTR